MYDSAGNFLYPIQGAAIECTTRFNKPSSGQGTGGINFPSGPSSPIEKFCSDATGKFQIRFIKRTKRLNVEGYYEIAISYYYLYSQEEGQGWSKRFEISVDEVRNAPNNIIVFDTIKFIK
jgi:hypothetical protein